jgi:hypothetical protein
VLVNQMTGPAVHSEPGEGTRKRSASCLGVIQHYIAGWQWVIYCATTVDKGLESLGKAGFEEQPLAYGLFSARRPYYKILILMIIFASESKEKETDADQTCSG